MDLTKVYYDQGGLSGNILQVIKREPEWAANRIQVGERALAMLTEEQRAAAESGEGANVVQHAQPAICPRCHSKLSTESGFDVCDKCGWCGGDAGKQQAVG